MADSAATNPDEGRVLTRTRLTRMIAEWLIEWADADGGRGSSRYPIPAWCDSSDLADRIFDAAKPGLNQRSVKA